MGAKEIKEEIKKLEPTQKLEIFKWVNDQINVAEFGSGIVTRNTIHSLPPGVYRSLGNPLKGDHKLKVTS